MKRKKNTLKKDKVKKQVEREISNRITPIRMYQDQEEFFEQNPEYTKSNFIRIAVDEKIRQIKIMKEKFQKTKEQE